MMSIVNKYFSSVFLSLFATSLLAAGPLQFGAVVDKTKVVALAEIVKSPDKYLNKEIVVEGIISEVCAKRGCWMTLVAKDSPDGKAQLRIKVNDGEMVFPLTARGKMAYAVGVLVSFTLNKHQAIEFLKHKAEEGKQPFDESKVLGPLTIFQLNTTGALIE